MTIPIYFFNDLEEFGGRLCGTKLSQTLENLLRKAKLYVSFMHFTSQQYVVTDFEHRAVSSMSSGCF